MEVNSEMMRRVAELCTINGASGSEDAVRAYLTSEVERLGLSWQTDALGNLIVQKPGHRIPAKPIMVSAHMDEVGFIITSVDEQGYLHFAPVGGIDPRVAPGRTVAVNGHPGVIGNVPIHLLSKKQREASIEFSDMAIDIGAADRQQALEVVQPGDMAYFAYPFTQLGGNRFAGKAIDDRAGCAVLLWLLEQELQNSCTVVFCTQEEVGLRGAKTAAFSVDPAVALIIEATTAADNLGLPAADTVCDLGAGAVVGFMDRSTIYDRELVQLAGHLSREKNIPLQYKKGVFGGNDAGAIHQSRAGVRTLAISLPCRNLHTASGVADWGDLQAVMELTHAVIDHVC